MLCWLLLLLCERVLRKRHFCGWGVMREVRGVLEQDVLSPEMLRGELMQAKLV